MSVLPASIELKDIRDKNDLAHIIDEATPLSAASSSALVSTALLLGEFQSIVDTQAPLSRLLPSNLVLLAPSADAPNVDAQKFLYDLVIGSEAAAVSMSCSSILAGQGSESDDTGDIGVWLGEGNYGRGHAGDVLERLGLSQWSGEGKISEQHLTYQNALPLNGHAKGQEVDKLVKLVDGLSDKYSFRVSSDMTGGIVVFFLIGRVERGWGGLIGTGTWSDLW